MIIYIYRFPLYIITPVQKTPANEQLTKVTKLRQFF